MTVVYFKPDQDNSEHEIQLKENESYLDGVLRSGFGAPFGCKGGVCQSCLMQMESGNIPPAAQQGLKESQIAQGFFLACCCHPERGFKASLPNISAKTTTAKVLEKAALSANVFRLKVENAINYRAGQYCTLWNTYNVARSYSIASVDSIDNHIEFHIKRIKNGAFSDWAWNHLTTGDEIYLQGPSGECFYALDDKNQTIFLSGIGTGLAPLYGIVRDALNQGHTGDIKLLLGAKKSSNFYLLDELFQLKQTHANLDIKFICQEDDNAMVSCDSTFSNGDIYQSLSQIIDDFKDVKVFLCGADSFVRKMKKHCFLAGANMKDILSDPFVPSGST